MAVINIDDAYILNETGEQVDKVTGLFTKDEDTTSGEKAFAQLNIGTAGSNRNLLDNPFFTVNQRNFTTSTGVNNFYSVDRWYIARGTGTISKTNNGITINGVGASRETTFQQMIDCGDLTGRTVALSVNDGGTIRQMTGIVPARTTSNNIFIRFTLRDGVSAFLYAMSTSSAYAYMLQVQVNAGYTLDLRAVKLELGSVSTLANDAPPDYAEELLKCLHYQWVVNAESVYGVVGDATVTTQNTEAMMVVHYPVPMYKVPTFSVSGAFRTVGGNGTAVVIGSVTSMAVTSNASNKNFARVTINGTTMGGTGTSVVVGANGAGAKLIFDANI